MTIHFLHMKVLVITGCNQFKPVTTEVWLQLVATSCDQLQLQLLTIALSCNWLQLQLLQIWSTTATQLDLQTLDMAGLWMGIGTHLMGIPLQRSPSAPA